MKKNYNLLVIILALVATTSWSQTTLVQWNFNGVDAASVPGGGNAPTPATGSGTIQLIGGITSDSPNAFAAGNNGTGVASSDPVTTSPPNLAWATFNYPAPGTANKTAGIQVNINTMGFADITFKFDQRLSNKSGNTYVVQYTADRNAGSPVWVDAQTFTVTPTSATGDLWYNVRTVDVTAVTSLDNNLNVAFRVVGAFDPTTGNYLATQSGGNTYDGLGKVRYDMVTVTSATTLSNTEFELNQNKFSVYPNPVKDNMIYFKEFSTVSLYDISGKSVLNGVNVKELNVSSLSSGVYLVKNGDGNVVKLIKE